MTVRLCHPKNRGQKMTLTNYAWFWLLETASRAGWVPMGTVRKHALHGIAAGAFPDSLDEEPGDGSYAPTANGLVMLEDALNLMDALERAFLEYMPQREGASRDAFATEWDEVRDAVRPGIGCWLALADFCRGGAFLIENI